MMRRIALFLVLLAGTRGLNSCESHNDYYEPTLYEVVAGPTWVGDLGFYDQYNVALESGVFLGQNGYGDDELCYYPPREECVGKLGVRWRCTGDSIYIDYGGLYAPDNAERGWGCGLLAVAPNHRMSRSVIQKTRGT